MSNLNCVKGALTDCKLTLLVSFYSLCVQYDGEKFGLPQRWSCSFKIIIIGVVSVYIFYIAKYYDDNVHDMFNCPKDVLAA